MENLLGHFHLVLNHLPIILLPLAATILAWGLSTNVQPYIRLALFLGLFAGLSAVPAFLTGEPAEEVVEEIQGVQEQAIDAHEEAAALALGASGVVSLLCLILLLGKKDSPAFRGQLHLAIGSMLIASMLLAWTGYQGGKIRHTEFNASSPGVAQNNEDD